MRHFEDLRFKKSKITPQFLFVFAAKPIISVAFVWLYLLVAPFDIISSAIKGYSERHLRSLVAPFKVVNSGT